ncbi:MAG: DUF3253 domain-containing protein [Pseudomonadota bacterium]
MTDPKSDHGAALQDALITLIEARGPGKTICPSEVARAVAGSNAKEWRLLMKPVKAIAVALAKDGKVTIRRKGKIIDPDAIKGIYRIGPADP